MIGAPLWSLGVHAKLIPVLVLNRVLGLCGLLEGRDHLMVPCPLAAPLLVREIEVVTLHLDVRLDMRAPPASIGILSSTHFILTSTRAARPSSAVPHPPWSARHPTPLCVSDDLPKHPLGRGRTFGARGRSESNHLPVRSARRSSVTTSRGSTP